MIKLLQFLISGCWHKWVTERQVTLTTEYGSIGTRALCRCEKCGKWTKFDLI